MKHSVPLCKPDGHLFLTPADIATLNACQRDCTLRTPLSVAVSDVLENLMDQILTTDEAIREQFFQKQRQSAMFHNDKDAGAFFTLCELLASKLCSMNPSHLVEKKKKKLHHSLSDEESSSHLRQPLHKLRPAKNETLASQIHVDLSLLRLALREWTRQIEKMGDKVAPEVVQTNSSKHVKSRLRCVPLQNVKSAEATTPSPAALTLKLRQGTTHPNRPVWDIEKLESLGIQRSEWHETMEELHASIPGVERLPRTYYNFLSHEMVTLHAGAKTTRQSNNREQVYTSHQFFPTLASQKVLVQQANDRHIKLHQHSCARRPETSIHQVSPILEVVDGSLPVAKPVTSSGAQSLSNSTIPEGRSVTRSWDEVSTLNAWSPDTHTRVSPTRKVSPLRVFDVQLQQKFAHEKSESPPIRGDYTKMCQKVGGEISRAWYNSVVEQRSTK